MYHIMFCKSEQKHLESKLFAAIFWSKTP